MFRSAFSVVTLTGCFAFLLPAAAAACPNVALAGPEIRATASMLYVPAEFAVQAGGDRDITRCGIRNRTDGKPQGFVAAAPDFELYFVQDGRFQLELRVVSECDSILLVNTGGGNWYWDDDDAGNLDAKIRLTRPSQGWYDIWIGTVDGRLCNAKLILESF
jgi:non-specific serine/threonine protein kinase